VSQFKEKVDIYSVIYTETKVLPAVFSLGGFTDEAMEFCKSNNIATTDLVIKILARRQIKIIRRRTIVC